MEIVKVKILFFAKASELCGTKETYSLIPSSITTLDLTNKVVEEFGLQCISNNILLSVNQEYVEKDGEKLLFLKEGDEIAVIPPISGG
nr:molybdopterin synthase sulfur carrier subunit isoform X3 [Halyomorpha halys]